MAFVWHTPPSWLSRPSKDPFDVADLGGGGKKGKEKSGKKINKQSDMNTSVCKQRFLWSNRNSSCCFSCKMLKSKRMNTTLNFTLYTHVGTCYQVSHLLNHFFFYAQLSGLLLCPRMKGQHHPKKGDIQLKERPCMLKGAKYLIQSFFKQYYYNHYITPASSIIYLLFKEIHAHKGPR